MKKLTFLLICLLTFLTVFAGEVTEAEALQKAQKFMQVNNKKRTYIIDFNPKEKVNDLAKRLNATLIKGSINKQIKNVVI